MLNVAVLNVNRAIHKLSCTNADWQNLCRYKHACLYIPCTIWNTLMRFISHASQLLYISLGQRSRYQKIILKLSYQKQIIPSLLMDLRKGNLILAQHHSWMYKSAQKHLKTSCILTNEITLIVVNRNYDANRVLISQKYKNAEE